jgi:hypothetical protein
MDRTSPKLDNSKDCLPEGYEEGTPFGACFDVVHAEGVRQSERRFFRSLVQKKLEKSLEKTGGDGVLKILSIIQKVAMVHIRPIFSSDSF